MFLKISDQFSFFWLELTLTVFDTWVFSMVSFISELGDNIVWSIKNMVVIGYTAFNILCRANWSRSEVQLMIRMFVGLTVWLRVFCGHSWIDLNMFYHISVDLLVSWSMYMINMCLTAVNILMVCSCILTYEQGSALGLLQSNVD